jgi:hypothetical protein
MKNAAAIHPVGGYRRSITQQARNPEIWQPTEIASGAV